MTHPPEPTRAGQARTSRRRFLGAAAGLAGATAAVQLATGGFGGGLLGATEGARRIGGSAEAGAPAERLRFRPPPPPTLRPAPEGMIAFPIDPAADSYVLDNYGDCRPGGFYDGMHIGVDIISERGAEVYAVERAVIQQDYTDTGTAGWGWALLTEDDVRYRYFHLDSLAPDLEVGDTVEFGQVLGWVGSSGNFIRDEDGELVEDRDNIHLHFEYWPEFTRERRVYRDPLPLLDVPDHISIGPPLKACAHREPS